MSSINISRILHCRILRILRPFLQFLIYTLAIYIALTRISDYRHHPTDVITGIIVGNLFAILILFLTVDLFRRPRSFFHTRYTILNNTIDNEVNGIRYSYDNAIWFKFLMSNLYQSLHSHLFYIEFTTCCCRRSLRCRWKGTKTKGNWWHKSNFYTR